MSRSSIRKSRIILPDELPEIDVNESDSHFQELMMEEIIEIEDEFNEPRDKRKSNEEDNSVAQHEIPSHDFFDVKVEKPQFGEIEGMSEVDRESDVEKEEIEKEATRLTNSVRDFVTKPSESSSKIDQESVRYTEEDLQKPTEDSKSSKEVTTLLEDDKPVIFSEEFITTPTDSTLYQGYSDSNVMHEDEAFSRPSLGVQKSTSIVKDPSRSESARQNVFYDMEDIQQLFDLDQQEPVLQLDDNGESVEEESEPSTVEEEEPALDRGPYYKKYDNLINEMHMNRTRNNILQKLVIMYMKRRKMENILKDVEPPLDQTQKYHQKLNAYKELFEINTAQRASMFAELENLREKRNIKNEELKNLFKCMQNRESNIGHGLIYAKTGSQIPDKLVDRLLKRQAVQTDQVSSMRLTYIKLKGMVQEKLSEIDKLDIIGDDLLLADFEQLKSDNRIHADKFEEREEELTRLRAKCQNTIQILAHIREKSFALDSDLYDLKEGFNDVDNMARDFRENLAFLKNSRDKYRQMTRKLKDESGLLLKPNLLKDMEESQKLFIQLEKDFAKCKHDTEHKKSQVRKLRMIMEGIKEEKKNGKSKKLEFHKSTTSVDEMKMTTVYKNRPALYIPIIKKDVFDGLIKIKPSPKVSNRKK